VLAAAPACPNPVAKASHLAMARITGSDSPRPADLEVPLGGVARAHGRVLHQVPYRALYLGRAAGDNARLSRR